MGIPSSTELRNDPSKCDLEYICLKGWRDAKDISKLNLHICPYLGISALVCGVLIASRRRRPSMTVTDATETSLSGSKDDVLRVLRSIEDPDLGMDIVTLLA